MHTVTKIGLMEGYRLDLTFDDGTQGIVDLAPLVGKGVFAAWIDMEYFRRVQIGPYGELAWGDDIDLCPDALYLEATGKRPEDVFPAIKQEGVRA